LIRRVRDDRQEGGGTVGAFAFDGRPILGKRALSVMKIAVRQFGIQLLP